MGPTSFLYIYILLFCTLMIANILGPLSKARDKNVFNYHFLHHIRRL
jgi:hypothetical protein